MIDHGNLIINSKLFQHSQCCNGFMLINLYLIPTFYEKLLKDPGSNVG